MSKEDRGVAAAHVLRLGEVLRARAGAGNAGGTCGGSGGGGATWRGEERASAGWEAATRTLGRHVARGKAVQGRQRRGTWPGMAAGHRAEKTESRGLEVDEGGSVCNFPKVRGLLCKA
jgi:hypothetical protein